MDESSGPLNLYGETSFQPVGLAVLILLGVMTLVVPRRYAVLPMMVMACFIPGQNLAVFTLNFNALRIIVLFGSVRVLLRGEWRGFAWKSIDVALVLWAVCGTVAYVALYATADALKFKLGAMYDAIGMYFFFRLVIRNWEDVHATVRGFVIISVPVAVAFLVERATGRNIFAVFGGVRAVTEVRDGKLRCQGAFAHPILAGCFWASLLPLFGAMWWRDRRGRAWAYIGVSACGIVIVCCASSTPLMAVLFGVVGASLFGLRAHMKRIRWGVVCFLVLLHFMMRGPVWSLIARVDVLSGSTGYYRFVLIDEAIHHFDEWWLVGVQSTSHWGAWLGPSGLTDVANQYVLEGVRGGFSTLVLFLVLIGLVFAGVGRLWRSADAGNQKMAWAMGVGVFVHCTSFLAVSYFGQIQMLWYLALAMIASLAPPRMWRRVRTQHVTRSSQRRNGPLLAVDNIAGGST